MTMGPSKSPKTIAAGDFKAKCLRIMDDVAATRRAVIVTKKGRPVVKVGPLDAEPARNIFGCLANRLEITGDIESPIVPSKAWEALR
jgi:prevent-host-death family protein